MRKVLFVLGQLTDDDVQWIAENGVKRVVPPGNTIITMGKQSDAIFIILDGEVSVTVEGVREVARLTCGEILGEMSLIDANPPSATITSVTESTLLEVSKSLLKRKMAEDIYFSAHFYRAIAVVLSHRLRTITAVKGGVAGGHLDEQGSMEDELDATVLDNVHLAGARFERMLKKVMGVDEA